MNTTDNNQTKRSPNGGPGHMRDTGAYPTVPLMEALAKRGVHVQAPPAIQPDEVTVPMPAPVDPAAANANSTHIWPVGNVRPAPQPRPAAPPVPPIDVAPPATRPDWRDRLIALPPRTRIALGVVLAAVLLVVAVLIGAVS